mgnify:CR=1 FL=1
MFPIFSTSIIVCTEFVIKIASGKRIDPTSKSSSITFILFSFNFSITYPLVIPGKSPFLRWGVNTLSPFTQNKLHDVVSVMSPF